jgi:hypothetical protein
MGNQFESQSKDQIKMNEDEEINEELYDQIYVFLFVVGSYIWFSL